MLCDRYWDVYGVKLLRITRLLAIPAVLFLASSVLAANTVPKQLSLHEAITLALRFNANVRNAELDRVNQKFALFMAKWYFMPHYKLGVSYSASQSKSARLSDGFVTDRGYGWKTGPDPEVSWNSKIGTNVSASASNTWGPGSVYDRAAVLKITQPLLKGFGSAITKINLENAYDTERENKLNLKNTIMSQINTTINDYTGVVQDESTLKVDQQALARAKKSYQETLQYIKAGTKPQSDAVQAKSQVASAEVSLQQEKTALQIAKYKLMQAIGLQPSTLVEVSSKLPLTLYSLPNEKRSIDMGLANNVTYQDSVIAIASTARALLKARDGMRWDLSLGETFTYGNEGDKAWLTNIIHNDKYNSTTTLDLTIPIDDMNSKKALVSAEISLQKAQVNLQQDKRDLEIQIMSDRNNLLNQQTQIKLDKEQVKLDKQNMLNAQRQYAAGMVSSLTVTQQSQTLSEAETRVVSDEVSYFNSLSSFDDELGHATKTWGINIRY